MTGKGKSRWADSAEDTALEAQLQKEREEKKRIKAEKARKAAEAERKKRQEAEAAAAAAQRQQQENDDDVNGPPAKRRRLSPERDAPQPQVAAPVSSSNDSSKLLRFESAGGFGKCRSVENYDKLNDIEEGAYGWVARAREIETGKVVALKRLKIDPKDRSGLPVTGLREIQILKDCSHRNIVKLKEVVVGDDTRSIENIFIVLEFLEHDLKSILEDMPEPFLASEVKTLLLQLCSGISYLHSHYILHRDLKTSNLLLNNRGQLKIADFGMARYYVPDSGQQKLTQLVVTLWYRAPELLLGTSKYGPEIDMWSVGCIFGELLTREPLLQGKNEVDELTKIFELCGIPTDESWPGFRRLPNARSLRLPSSTSSAPTPSTKTLIRAKFPLLTAAGVSLLSSLLSLNPSRRPTASEMLEHEYFLQDPKPKNEAMFPTFPSKAGQERRRKRETPNAPQRNGAQKDGEGGGIDFGAVQLGGIFGMGREREERGGGFSLRMV